MTAYRKSIPGTSAILDRVVMVWEERKDGVVEENESEGGGGC